MRTASILREIKVWTKRSPLPSYNLGRYVGRRTDLQPRQLGGFTAPKPLYIRLYGSVDSRSMNTLMDLNTYYQRDTLAHPA